ncbi:MAG: Uma2 family endonuclease [Bacteroidota bacterium]
MEIAAIQKKPAALPSFATAKPKERRISWEEFQRQYLTREDEYTYEWLDGVVEKTKRTMDWTQFIILRNLQAFFRRLIFEGKAHGELISEGDTFFLSHHRRPDIAWFSEEQIDKTVQGIKPLPRFVIEVISTHDKAIKVAKKMQDYRAAGVEVVWKIFPDTEEVEVCSGDQLKEIKVCFGEDLCSAAPVLPAFVLPANDIFKKPVKAA